MHRIDGTVEIRYTPDVIINSGALNKTNQHSTSDRKWWQVGGDGPIGALFGKKFANWLRGIDSKLEGNHDAVNQGGSGGSEAREIKGGTGALSVILAPFTIAGGNVYVAFGAVGMLNGADDMIGAIKNADNVSLIQSLISDPNYKNLVGNMKTGATFFTAIGGGIQMWKMGTDVPTLIGITNDSQSLIRDIYDRVKQNKKINKGQ